MGREGAVILQGCKIIVILGYFDMGGAERQALLLTDYLKNVQNADVQIWGFRKGEMFARICGERGIPIRIFSFDWTENLILLLKKLSSLARVLRKEKPDVIMSYTLVPDIVGGLIWKYTGAKLYIWGQRDEGRGLSKRRIMLHAIKSTHHFISNSFHGKELLIREYGVTRESIKVINNGIVIPACIVEEENKKIKRAKYGECFVATMLANFHGYKDHATLIRAWELVTRKLKEKGRKSLLLLPGRDDGTRSKLAEMVYSKNLSENVLFSDSVDNISAILNSADIGVHSSQYEGSPNGLLECMAAGLAVAGTDIPGIREAVGCENYKYLAPVEDYENLAEIILTFAQNDDLRINTGLNNRKRVQQYFDLNNMCYETSKYINDNLCHRDYKHI
jgi:glycosyltransferase involved in cell wall biosynthesis